MNDINTLMTFSKLIFALKEPSKFSITNYVFYLQNPTQKIIYKQPIPFASRHSIVGWFLRIADMHCRHALQTCIAGMHHRHASQTCIADMHYSILYYLSLTQEKSPQAKAQSIVFDAKVLNQECG